MGFCFWGDVLLVFLAAFSSLWSLPVFWRDGRIASVGLFLSYSAGFVLFSAFPFCICVSHLMYILSVLAYMRVWR